MERNFNLFFLFLTFFFLIVILLHTPAKAKIPERGKIYKGREIEPKEKGEKKGHKLSESKVKVTKEK